MGLRQLRHPVQGLRIGWDASDGPREDRRRRDRPPVHRPCPHRCPAHPVGPGGRLLCPAAVRRGPRCRPGHDQQQHVPGRGLQARQPHSQRPRRPTRSSIRPPAVATRCDGWTGIFSSPGRNPPCIPVRHCNSCTNHHIGIWPLRKSPRPHSCEPLAFHWIRRVFAAHRAGWRAATPNCSRRGPSI